MRFASAASRAQWTLPAGAPDGRLELEQVLVEAARARRSLIARPASRSSSQSGSSATTRGALRADRRRRVAEVRRSWVVRERRARARLRERRHRGSGLASPARISARCTVRTPAAAAPRPPPMCIRHELSPAVHTSAPVVADAASLSASIAAEVSAFLTANVPPKPQHSSASGSSTSSMPAHRPQQPQRRVADARASAGSGRSGGT